MSKRPSLLASPLASDLALIASTVLATLAVHRHVTRPATTGAIDPEILRSAARQSPLAVIALRWKEILLGTYNRIGRDRILATAAGVVFYGLLAIFPAITALVSSYGLFADPSTISDNLHSLALMLPGDSFSIVQDEITRVLDKANGSLSLAFCFGLGLAIWSSNAGVKAVLDALNVAHEVEEKRGFIHLNLVSLAFTPFGSLGDVVLGVLAVGLDPIKAPVHRRSNLLGHDRGVGERAVRRGQVTDGAVLFVAQSADLNEAARVGKAQELLDLVDALLLVRGECDHWIMSSVIWHSSSNG